MPSVASHPSLALLRVMRHHLQLSMNPVPLAPTCLVMGLTSDLDGVLDVMRLPTALSHVKNSTGSLTKSTAPFFRNTMTRLLKVVQRRSHLMKKCRKSREKFHLFYPANKFCVSGLQ
ncbi:unnamed protein product [Hymenolepis diminuta]|uniref:Uncharacterized protein n=1 Tax=Hymenolepis diminuta TaxID=6216 RepID=A0A564YNV8_HYMDI|nr:unnamed protein product [Hymenolepis diminuta]